MSHKRTPPAEIAEEESMTIIEVVIRAMQLAMNCMRLERQVSGIVSYFESDKGEDEGEAAGEVAISLGKTQLELTSKQGKLLEICKALAQRLGKSVPINHQEALALLDELSANDVQQALLGR